MKRVLALILIISFFPNICFAQNLWQNKFSNDYGDYLYFDSSEVNNLKRTYNNFTCSDNDNYIELSRLDYQNKDRTDYIYMEKSTDGECWINIDINKNYRARSSKKYDYFLLEADIKSEVKGAKTFIFMLNGTTPVLQLHTDGYLYSKGTKLNKSIVSTEWTNVKAAVDIPNKLVDIYINGALAISITLVTFKTDELTSVKTNMVQGNGNFYIDNYRITGLDFKYQNGTEQKSSIFGDYLNEKKFLNDKTAFSRYGNYFVRGNEHFPLSEKVLFENGAIYASADDFKRAFDANAVYDKTTDTVLLGNLKIGADGKVYQNGKVTKTLEKSFVIRENKVYFPVDVFCIEVLGKKTAYDEKTGLIVIADSDVSISNDNWDYFSMRDSSARITQFNNLDLLNNFVMYERPTVQKLYDDAINSGSLNVHPRIILNAQKIDEIKENIQTNAEFEKLYDRFMQKAEAKLKENVTEYEFSDNIRMAKLSAVNIMYLALAWNLTGDERYLEKGWLELKSVAEFPDYNLASIIFSGIANELLAIGYDWLYNGLSEQRREFIENALFNKALKPLADGYYGRIFARGDDWSTLKWASNMNAVANTGAICASAALFDKYPDYCLDVISKAVKSLEYTMVMYAPDGAWNEGLWYWHYCATFLGVGLCALKSVFSSTYGLENAQGFDKTQYAVMALIGPCGINNFGDAEFEKVSSYSSFGLISQCTGNDFLGAVRVNSLLSNENETVLPVDILSYKKHSDASYPNEKVTKISCGETFTARKDYDINSQNLYFSTHFGTSSGYHQHNDTGTFVYDILGERWAEDLGWEDYKVQNTYGYSASDIYRMRAEGHNVLVINPSSEPGQKAKRFVPIKNYGSSENEAFVTADLSELYENSESVKMGYFIGDNMQSVTARYEIEYSENTEIYWFMHTKADINIENGGAYLTKNGKKIYLRFECENASAEISKMKAEPLPTSPQIDVQNKNTEYSKVAVKLTGKGKMTLTVKLSPIEITNIKNDSLDNWKTE